MFSLRYSTSRLRCYFAIGLLAAVAISCSRVPSDAAPKSTFLIDVDIAGQTATLPVSFLDNYLAKHSFSKDGGLYDNHHTLRGISYHDRSRKMLLIVGVGNGTEMGFVNVGAFSYVDSPDDFKKLFSDLQEELAKRFPGRPMKTQFE